MTARTFCQSGNSEGVKLAVHGGMLLGAAACCGYNTAAWYYRGETHNAVNALVYFALILLEIAHVTHHAEGRNGA
jgi:hypothetical protein